jgi:hypothetical protein
LDPFDDSDPLGFDCFLFNGRKDELRSNFVEPVQLEFFWYKYAQSFKLFFKLLLSSDLGFYWIFSAIKLVPLLQVLMAVVKARTKPRC